MYKKFALNFCILTVGVLSLSACDLATNTLKADRGGNMEIQDFRDGLAARQVEVDDDDTAGIPAFQPYISGIEDDLKPVPLVSISVNQTVPLKDVFFELAQQAEYDIELDPNIRGSIIFTARERPFDVVVDRIAEIAGLRYTFEDGVLRVEEDNPYNATYKIDFLNYVRENSSTISNDISVVSGDEADTGSSFNSSTLSESDFWGELEANLTQVLGNAQNRSLKTSRDPRITAVEQNPELAAVGPEGGVDGIQVQAPEAVLRVDSLPIEDEVNPGSLPGAVNGVEDSIFSFAVNRQAGLISVFANQRAHSEVRDYIKLVKKATTTQVLIEAKIFEVQLFDEYSAGIDWNALDLLSGELPIGFGTASDIIASGSTLGTVASTSVLADLNVIGARTATNFDNGNNFVVGYLGNDIQAIAQAMQGFGVTKALASPRLTVLNNQSAVLNVATNVVYFEIDIDRTEGTDGTGDTIEIDSDIKNVPEGVLVNVLPSVDLENNTVTMALRPTITRISQRVADPGVAFVAQSANIDIESGIPELNVQEIDSIIKVRSGQPVILGGLLQDRTVISEASVPVLGEVPIMGNLFKKTSDQITKTELVILLKATIIEGDDNVHSTDKDLYRKFSGDRRPFKL